MRKPRPRLTLGPSGCPSALDPVLKLGRSPALSPVSRFSAPMCPHECAQWAHLTEGAGKLEAPGSRCGRRAWTPREPRAEGSRAPVGCERGSEHRVGARYERNG